MKLKDEIHALLLASTDGMTIRELIDRTGAADKNVRFALYGLPVAYISGWKWPRQGPMASVWNVVEVPANAPKPVATEAEKAARAEAKRQYNRDYHREGKRPDRRKSVREMLAQPEVSKPTKSQSLTTIRGPWPTHA